MNRCDEVDLPSFQSSQPSEETERPAAASSDIVDLISKSLLVPAAADDTLELPAAAASEPTGNTVDLSSESLLTSAADVTLQLPVAERTENTGDLSTLASRDMSDGEETPDEIDLPDSDQEYDLTQTSDPSPQRTAGVLDMDAAASPSLSSSDSDDIFGEEVSLRSFCMLCDWLCSRPVADAAAETAAAETAVSPQPSGGVLQYSPPPSQEAASPTLSSQGDSILCYSPPATRANEPRTAASGGRLGAAGAGPRARQRVDQSEPPPTQQAAAAVAPQPGRPDYTKCTLAELQANVQQYGLRVTGKRNMVQQLNHIWEVMAAEAAGQPPSPAASAAGPAPPAAAPPAAAAAAARHDGASGGGGAARGSKRVSASVSATQGVRRRVSCAALLPHNSIR